MMNLLGRSQRYLSLVFKRPVISFHTFSPQTCILRKPFCSPCDKVILKSLQCKGIFTTSYLQREGGSEYEVKNLSCCDIPRNSTVSKLLIYFLIR